MEIFRKLGIADALRNTPKVPYGWSDAATFSTSLTGELLDRFDGVFSLPNVQSDDLSEPALWCPQNQTEEGLRVALADRESLDQLIGWSLTHVQQDEDGVELVVGSSDEGTRSLRVKYAIAADGSRSAVRKQLGIKLAGSTDAIRNMQVTFYAPGLAMAHKLGPAVQYWVVNPEVSGLMGQLDLDGHWWAIILNAPEEATDEWLRQAIGTMIGADVPFVLGTRDPWTARMLVAEDYRQDRIFLAGDAAHLNPPWGGFGANTGIGDAMDISWKLAAVLHGWGGEQLLDSYEAERKPMAERTIREASRNMAALGDRLVHPSMLATGPDGAAARVCVAETLRAVKTAELYTTGFVLGARYEGSPAIQYDAGPTPESSTIVYRRSSAPGSRLPHIWLSGGQALVDLLGHGISLVNLSSPDDSEMWEEAAGRAGVPLTYIRINRPDLRQTWEAGYLLVRPDGVIAWRGHKSPNDLSTVIDRVRGCASSLVTS